MKNNSKELCAGCRFSWLVHTKGQTAFECRKQKTLVNLKIESMPLNVFGVRNQKCLDKKLFKGGTNNAQKNKTVCP